MGAPRPTFIRPPLKEKIAERKLKKFGERAADVLEREETKDMRPPCSSLDAFVTREQAEKKVNDKDIAKDVEVDTKDAYETKVIHISHGNHIINPYNNSHSRLQEPKFTRKVGTQVTEWVVSPYLNDKELNRLSTSCVTLYTQTNKIREKKAFLRYLQAVIFNDPTIIPHILASYPDFLFAKPENYHIKQIECQHTWLQYCTEGESVFSMAQKLRHVDAVNAMFKFYQEKLKDAEVKEDKSRITELKDMWILRMPTEEEQIALQDKYIQEYFLPMIDILAADTTIEVRWVENPETKLLEAKIENANETTLQALQALRDRLFKPKAMKDCIDVDQFLIAAYLTFNFYFHRFKTLSQLDAYAIWCIGLGQSLVGRELAEIFCQSLRDVINNNHAIEERARSLLLADNRSFYRLSRYDSGLGASFLCNVTARAWGGLRSNNITAPTIYLDHLYQAKASNCEWLTQQVHPDREKPSLCVVS